MQNKIVIYFCLIWGKAIRMVRDFFSYFYKGWQAGLLGAYGSAFFRSFYFYAQRFRNNLSLEKGLFYHIEDEKIKKLTRGTPGLYSLLPKDDRFTYSVLLTVAHPNPGCMKQTILSIINQGIPSLQILLGVTEKPSEKLQEVFDSFSEISVFSFYGEDNKTVMNELAKKSTGNFLLLMREEDWIRPDYLYRFEQTLRIVPNPEKTVVYSDANGINDGGFGVPGSLQREPSSLCFPFVFKQFGLRGWLIPSELWKLAGGVSVNPLFAGAEYDNLLLQLYAAGAIFQHVPFSLYFFRLHRPQSSSRDAFLAVLEKFSEQKLRPWKWTAGYQSDTVRAIPPLSSHSMIQVIIPYKDEKEMTMKCIQTLLNQKDISFRITAIDNRSKDTSIAKDITALGGEVLFIDEPFNYSRLNNLAVQRTKFAPQCPIILFLNNDIELAPDALSEMLRWVDQPGIGVVGCRLHYPDGRLQHGGVTLTPYGMEKMRWEHTEKLRSFEIMDQTKRLGLFDAVTFACAMMQRSVFLEVGGFDEVCYPVAYSDTDLCFRLSSRGLKSFYTPYATAIHHESVSRKTGIEDVENSWWLHRKLYKNDSF